MKTRWFTIITFCVVGLLALLPIFLLGVIAGPQELHYYNLTISGAVVIGVLFSLAGLNRQDFKKTENVTLFIVAIFSLIAFSLFSKFWIDNKYGYSNWSYRNAWTIYYDQDESFIKWTNYSLDVLMNDIIQFQTINGRYPDSLEELPEKTKYKELKDSWNEEIKYSKQPEMIILTSAGPDKMLNTDDDLIRRIEN